MVRFSTFWLLSLLAEFARGWRYPRAFPLEKHLGDKFFMAFKDMYWNDSMGVRQCNDAAGCNDLSIDGKVEALAANFRVFFDLKIVELCSCHRTAIKV